MSVDLESGDPEIDAGPPPESAISRLGGVLFAPDETYQSIARRPTWAGALLIIVTISLICSALTAPRIDYMSAAREQMAKRTDMSAEQKERGMRLSKALTQVLGYAAPILLPAWWAIVAGIMLLLFRLFGADGTYKQAFAVKVYAALPLLINKIVRTVLVFVRGHVDAEELATLVRSNLGFLVDPVKNRPMFALLGSLDVFAIWSLILATIGYAYMAKVSKAKSAIAVFGVWVVGLTLAVGLTALFSSFGK